MIIKLIYDPTAAPFVGAIIPETHFTSFTKILLFFFHGYTLIPVHVSIFVISTVLLLLPFYFVPVLTHELMLGKTFYKYGNGLRKTENLRHAFRGCQILMQNMLCVLGMFAFIGKSLGQITAVYCNFVLIHYWNELEIVSKCHQIIIAVSLQILCGVLLQFGGFLHCRGVKLLGSWKRMEWICSMERKSMKKFQRSCKPIIICWGNRFVISRVSFIQFLFGVIRLTCKALIMASR